MIPSTRRFRVGAIVLGAGALFVGLLVFIAGSGFSAERARYHILFDENVKGMVVGSKVNFQGVPFGVVSDILFDKGLTRVEIDVDPTRAVIQQVTTARLDRLLVTGQVTVELEGWEPTGKRLAAGSAIAPKADPLHSLAKSLPETVAEVMKLVNGLQETVTRTNAMLGDDNRRHLSGILANLERTTSALPEQLQTTTHRLDELLADAQKTAASVDRLTAALADSAGADTKALLEQARTALQRLQGLEDEFAALSGEAKGTLAALRAPVGAAFGSLRAALDEMRGLARTLRLAPDSLIYGVRPAEAAAPLGGDK